MTVPEALQDPKLRRYRLRRHRLHCAGGELSVVAPARADDLLEGDAGAECLRRRQMPYWAEIWPASVALARHLMRGPSLSGVRVMDLGCGIGTPGLAAARRGARVHFVDLDPEALHFAAFNTRTISAERVSFEQLDWFEATVDGQFDQILLADVAYEVRNFEPLRRHLRSCLTEGGHGLLSDPYREATDAFLDWLQPEYRGNMSATDTFFDGTRIAVRMATLSQAEEGVTP